MKVRLSLRFNTTVHDTLPLRGSTIRSKYTLHTPSTRSKRTCTRHAYTRARRYSNTPGYTQNATANPKNKNDTLKRSATKSNVSINTFTLTVHHTPIVLVSWTTRIIRPPPWVNHDSGWEYSPFPSIVYHRHMHATRMVAETSHDQAF